MVPGNEFFLRKMTHRKEVATNALLSYWLNEIELNPLVGTEVSLEFLGSIQCIHCARSIKKTFNQGYCFPCAQRLACCDLCIVKPELCHFHRGSCREPEWGAQHCLQDHLVYLANTTGLKVGITRFHNRFRRWGDQGALQALPLFLVKERLHAGQIEKELSKSIADKSDWRKLITGRGDAVDLQVERERALKLVPADVAFEDLSSTEYNSVETLSYPVESYLGKAKVHSFEKESELRGILHGIRGQYLFIGGAAVNVRKYQGFRMRFSA